MLGGCGGEEMLVVQTCWLIVGYLYWRGRGGSAGSGGDGGGRGGGGGEVLMMMIGWSM